VTSKRRPQKYKKKCLKERNVIRAKTISENKKREQIVYEFSLFKLQYERKNGVDIKLSRFIFQQACGIRTTIY
jgi:hypothetical protein